MWRNSLSFSSKLLASSDPNSKFTFLSSAISTANYGLARWVSHSASSPEDLNAGFSKLDRVRSSGFASSADAIDASSLAAASAASRARDAVDLARHYGQCYWELSKARLSMLVVATSGAGYVLGSGSAIDYVGLCCTCAGTMMVAASANSLNQVFEINNDAKMMRTMNRPLPSARITVPHAVSWASSVGAAGTALLACQANMLAAGLAASNLFLYAFVYTPLKQIHPVNTWVGAVVGAIPPLLGWVAASGQVSLNGMVLPAALYFWQIPHFMALAYLCRNDYAAGGGNVEPAKDDLVKNSLSSVINAAAVMLLMACFVISLNRTIVINFTGYIDISGSWFRMFSLADASGERTALVALRNCIYLIPLGYLAYDWGITSGWFCLESTLLALAISGTALSFYLNRTTKNARRMFHASLLYLPVFMSGLLFHRIPDNLQLVGEDEKSERADENLSSSETLAQEIEINGQNKVKYAGFGAQARPPVAFASVAPFPFLPAPIYPTS